MKKKEAIRCLYFWHHSLKVEFPKCEFVQVLANEDPDLEFNSVTHFCIVQNPQKVHIHIHLVKHRTQNLLNIIRKNILVKVISHHQ